MRMIERLQIPVTPEFKQEVAAAAQARNPMSPYANVAAYTRYALRLMLAIDEHGWDVAREDFDHEAEDKNES